VAWRLFVAALVDAKHPATQLNDGLTAAQVPLLQVKLKDPGVVAVLEPTLLDKI
jgi:hypothetical protein